MWLSIQTRQASQHSSKQDSRCKHCTGTGTVGPALQACEVQGPMRQTQAMLKQAVLLPLVQQWAARGVLTGGLGPSTCWCAAAPPRGTTLPTSSRSSSWSGTGRGHDQQTAMIHMAISRWKCCGSCCCQPTKHKWSTLSLTST